MSTPPPPGPYSDPPAGGQEPSGQQPYGGQYGGQQPYGGQYGQQQPYGGQQPYDRQPYGQSPGSPSSDDRTIAVLAHLSPLIAILLSAGLLSVLGPLIVWLIWRDRGPLVRNAAASAFNFNVTVWVAGIIGWICLITVVLIPLAVILWTGAFLAQVVLSIKGAIHASRGEVYRYPWQVPILS